MFHDKSMKPIYYRIKRSNVNISHKNSAGEGLRTLVSAGFLDFFLLNMLVQIHITWPL